MARLQRQNNSTRSLWTTLGYTLLAAAILLGGYLVYSSVRADSIADQQREARQQQEAREQSEKAEAIAENEKKAQEIEYLKCQVRAEQAFIDARDQIPTGYSTSQHIQMLQTLEQKRSTDLDNCDRGNK